VTLGIRNDVRRTST